MSHTSFRRASKVVLVPLLLAAGTAMTTLQGCSDEPTHHNSAQSSVADSTKHASGHVAPSGGGYHWWMYNNTGARPVSAPTFESHAPVGGTSAVRAAPSIGRGGFGVTARGFGFGG